MERDGDVAYASVGQKNYAAGYVTGGASCGVHAQMECALAGSTNHGLSPFKYSLTSTLPSPRSRAECVSLIQLSIQILVL